MANLPQSAAEAFVLIAKTEFSEFDKSDFETFSGCESERPLIGYSEDLTIVIDGDMAQFQLDGDWVMFRLFPAIGG